VSTKQALEKLHEAVAKAKEVGVGAATTSAVEACLPALRLAPPVPLA
jgi:hypothetical protein